MRITNKDIQRVSVFFDNVVPDGIKCPICGNNDWIIGDTIADISMSRGDEDYTFPTIIISCKHCGNVQFFNAFKIGLQEYKETETDNSSK